jgi:3'(2'), 5'-bisphosphate nucleotidase
MLQDVLALAREAGRKIMAIYDAGDVGIQGKADGSPLTAADLASHRAIVAGLQKIQPERPILSEESAAMSYESRRLWRCFWLVDPLDGTKEFIKRNGEFTINIALIADGIPVLGVVYAPVPDICYYAERGSGAFVQRGAAAAQSIRAKRIVPGENIKVVASRSHSDARTAALLERLGDHDCVSMGSSLKLCLVAEGAAHFYPRLGPTMEWDTAAAHAVVIAAGGTVCDSSGTELRYNKQDMHNPEFFVCHAEEKQLLKQLAVNTE